MPTPRTPRAHVRAAACAVLVLALPLAMGCSDDIEGSVSVVGSSTLLPYVSGVAGDFAAQNPLTSVSLRMDGTAAGMTMFCDGSVPIAAASRPMSDAERVACRASGVKWVELEVGKDAIVAFTGPRNTAVTCVSPADLYALTGSEAGGGTTWKSATRIARALGSRTTLPATPLVVVTPNPASGTRQLFVDRVVAPFAQRRGAPVDLRVDHRDVPRELDMLAEADADPGLLAIAGEATVRPWGAHVRTLAVRNAGQCVSPTPDTIASGSYPLSRPLSIYVNVGQAQTRAPVQALVDALVAPGTLATAGDGAAVPLTSDGITATRTKWEAAVAGTQAG